MARRQIEHELDPVSAAIERVLAAERSAEVTLRTYRQQADALLAAARERAAAITRQADVRISKLHTAYFNKVSTEVAKLTDAPASAGEAIAGSMEDARLVGAAQRVAAKLTGGT